MLGTFYSAQGQAIIDSTTNYPRSGDEIIRHRLKSLDPGDQGEHVLWDFSDLSEVEEKEVVEFFCDSNSTMIRLEPDRMVKTTILRDSLLYTGYETPLIYMHYSEPALLLTYPFAYRNLVEESYKGEGTYCMKQRIEESGTFVSEVDAYGSIILSEGDTLRNVVRLHTTRISSVGMSTINNANQNNDTGKRIQEIEECHQWYARGYRYPVFESICLTSYDELEPVASEQRAFRCLPKDQEIEEDKVNKTLLTEDSLSQVAETDIIHYSIDFDGHTLSLDYKLDEDACVNVLICDRMGVLYHRRILEGTEGERYKDTFDCTALRKGEYVLYINVNAKIYNEKFIVR